MLRVACLAVVVAACTVGSGGSTQNDASADGARADSSTPIDASVDAPPSGGTSSLKVTFTTTETATPMFAPNNIVAVWIQNAAGNHVKTIGRWANVRKQYLLGWI